MIKTIVQDDNILHKNAKKYLDYCEMFFVEKISADFPNHLDIIVIEAKKRLANVSNFSEKQSFSDFIQKCTTKKQIINLDFKTQLKKSFTEKSLNGNLNNIKLSWLKLNGQNKIFVEEQKILNQLINSLNNTLSSEMDVILKKTNFLLREDKNLFSSDVLASAVFNMIKLQFQNHRSVCLALSFFCDLWPNLLINYFKEINNYLNNIDFETYQKSKTSHVFDGNAIVLDFNNFISSTESFDSANAIKNTERNIVVPPVETKIADFNIHDNISFNSSKTDEINKTQFNNVLIDNVQIPPEKKLNEIDYSVEVQQFILESEDILISQQLNNNFPEINELLFTSLIQKSNGLNVSKILNNSLFMKSINNLQIKIIKLPTNYFLNEKVFSVSILNEIFKNKSFFLDMNAHDIFIFKLLIKTYNFLLNSKELPIEQKAVLYKTQLWILQISLLRQSFLYDMNHPGRIFISYLINNESLLNQRLIKKYHEVINNITIPNNIDIEFFISIINKFKQYTQQDLNKQISLISEHINNIQESEKLDYFHQRILFNIKKISSKTNYEPLKVFIEQCWVSAFLNVFYKKLTYETVDSSDFVKELPLEIKLAWHQSSLIFDMMIFIVENKDKNPAQVEKIKSFFSKINEGLSKMSFELNIDQDHIKSLFNFLKYRFESFMKTSDEVTLEELFNKKTILEKDFILSSNKYIANIISLEKTNNEIMNMKLNFEELLNVDHWYHYNKNNYKLVYASPSYKNFILFSPETNLIANYNKMKLWYVMKNKVFHNINNKYSNLNFMNYLIESIKELKIEYEKR